MSAGIDADGVGNSVIAPAVVMRPMRLGLPASVNRARHPVLR